MATTGSYQHSTYKSISSQINIIVESYRYFGALQSKGKIPEDMFLSKGGAIGELIKKEGKRAKNFSDRQVTMRKHTEPTAMETLESIKSDLKTMPSAKNRKLLCYIEVVLELYIYIYINIYIYIYY